MLNLAMESHSTKYTKEDAEHLNRRLKDAPAEEIMRYALDVFGDRFTIASSFGAEDVVLIDMAVRIDPAARIFTLDTGRLHQETYELIDRLRFRYHIEFEVVFPNHVDLQQLIRTKGPNSFYDSIENRKECCHVRKVEPLGRVLRTADCWATGIRREQSVTRAEVPVVSVDEINGGILKVNPLVNWTGDEVWQYIRENAVPYNVLHDRGFPSIGCAPCTRAVAAGEDNRAGRWWWESPDQKECGLHARSS